ncbi:ABC transporter ATP-binding protein [Infirmifilum lucidum]|uniref:ABC transporter ATP-binding protein n=1 Tax=Infirmifilum lucidum TaxID=2776706 RepID=A0A7L9FKM8_9CREN|nr:ABC transporter ATP-binding protein [Infirmifilum lucidum]QOJ79365.1 ABC transporter ATP-binding protein [Infirmifilum lucidum]
MLTAEGVWVSLPGVGSVLKEVSLEVRAGEITGLLGPNGAGKTTLILAMAGLLKIERGRILLDGRDLYSQLPHARRRIGVVFQDPDDQLFNPTVRDELLFALDQLGLSSKEKEERVARVSAQLGIEDLLERPVHALSFGEKRRVAIASILVYDPEVVLFDEPTANLDARSVKLLLDTICELRRERKAVLVATHDVELVSRVADRVFVLYDGRITWSGSPPIPREILEDASLSNSVGGCAE